MSTKKQNTTALTTEIITPVKVFIGIDYHPRNVIGSPRNTLKTLNAKALHESKDSPNG